MSAPVSLQAPGPAEPAGAASYARRFADRYDTWFGRKGLTNDTVDLLARLAGSGTALELGVGTGRIALPLARRGVRVEGVDASPEMAARLAARPGGEHIPVAIGDFTRLPSDGRTVDVVFLAGGTFFELPTQEDQSRCFRHAAALIGDDGAFVLDAIVPEVLIGAEWSRGHVVPETGEDLVVLYRRFDSAAQRYHSHYAITPADGSGNVHIHVAFRYAGAGELDLMARAAGLELRERYGSWGGAPFRDGCPYHVSVYRPARRPGAPDRA
ncbi:class I SAM-dependent DNA methyltransferase [Streptomyces uncialis]|uniref:class I SAM-dependent DNA methyltransferase n=1 Tax=Streptomyces uncialis TaxID=1048205 RepID=UPI00224D563A|nr:class I SAM-dependent methyltransferase [Streptomyces uncialis]MCX4658714.1 class I SAM-dependent methyltransferase [Streptomyces uncialis]